MIGGLVKPSVNLSIYKSLFNNYVTLGCLYAKFRWLIFHVQLSFQPLSVNVFRHLRDTFLVS